MRYNILKFDPIGARAAELKDGGLSVQLPTRALTSAELVHAKKLNRMGLINDDFRHPIFEITRGFRPNTLRAITSTPEVSSAIQKDIEKFSSEGGRRFTIFHPALRSATNRVNDVLVETQLQSDVDFITITDNPESSISDFEKRAKSSIRKIDDSGEPKTAMPILWMGMDERRFARCIEVLKRLGVSALNISYAGIVQNYQNYSLLRQFGRTGHVFIHASEVTRTWRGNKKTSLPHVLTLFSVDSVATMSRPLPFGLVKIISKPAKRFDGGTLAHITKEEHMERYGDDSGCTCQTCRGRTINEFYDVFSGTENLNPALKVHETNQSLKQMYDAHSAILAKSFREHLRRKAYMPEAVRKICGIDLATRSLAS